MLAYLTLVFGELAPKRVAMQRAEGWGLIAARPLALLSAITRPAVWLLSHSTDLAVRLMGGDPERQREEVSEEELRDLVGTHRAVSPLQRAILSGAFEITDRTLGQVLRARRDVVVLTAASSSADALEVLVASGHSRAPVAEGGDLDDVVGVVHLRDVIGAGATPVRDRAAPALFIPESAKVLDSLRRLQEERQQLAVVVDEHGGGAGIVTLEDLLEELVGEIYDETDRDVAGVQREADGSLVLAGHFPIHDLGDLGVELPEGDYATVAGWCSPSSAGFPTDRVMQCASTDGPPPSWPSTTTRSPVSVYAAMPRKGKAANDSRAAPTSSLVTPLQRRHAHERGSSPVRLACTRLGTSHVDRCRRAADALRFGPRRCLQSLGAGKVVAAGVQAPPALDHRRGALGCDFCPQVVEQGTKALANLNGVAARVEDLVDCQGDVVVPGGLRHHDPHRALGALADPVRERAVRKVPEQVVKMVQALRRCCRVVYPGRERPLGDVDQLAKSEGGVLGRITFLGEREGCSDRVDVNVSVAPDGDEGHAMGDEVADTRNDGNAHISSHGEMTQPLAGHRRDNAPCRRVDGSAGGEERGDGDVERAGLAGVHAVDGIGRLAADAIDDLDDPDRRRDVVDVLHEQRDRNKDQGEGDADGDAGHELVDRAVLASHFAQYQ